MKIGWLGALILLVTGCHYGPEGTLGERCKADGTCVGDHLICDMASQCVANNAPAAGSGCYAPSECFCKRCAEGCADAGMKACNYTDTSVWGAKPATCECK
jgi:hypothetical protein